MKDINENPSQVRDCLLKVYSSPHRMCGTKAFRIKWIAMQQSSISNEEYYRLIENDSNEEYYRPIENERKG